MPTSWIGHSDLYSYSKYIVCVVDSFTAWLMILVYVCDKQLRRYWICQLLKYVYLTLHILIWLLHLDLLCCHIVCLPKLCIHL